MALCLAAALPVLQANAEGNDPVTVEGCSIVTEDNGETYRITCPEGALEHLNGSSGAFLSGSNSEDSFNAEGLQLDSPDNLQTTVTFTKEALEKTGVYIPEGTYTTAKLQVVVGIDNPVRYDYPLNTGSGLYIPQINEMAKVLPEGITVKADDAGIHISCTASSACSLYLDTMYDTCNLNNNPQELRGYYSNGNSTLKGGPEGGPPLNMIPTFNDGNVFTKVPGTDGKTAGLLIPMETVKNSGSGKDWVKNGADFAQSTLFVIGYDTVTANGFKIEKAPVIEVKVTFKQAGVNGGIVIESEDTAFLQAVDQLTVKGENITLSADNKQFAADGKSFTVPVSVLRYNYASWGEGTFPATVSGGGKEASGEVTLAHDFKNAPDGIKINVIGDGFTVRCADEKYLEVISKGQDITGIPGTNLTGNDSQGTPSADGLFQAYRKDFPFELKTDENGSYVMIAAEWADLEKIGAREDKAYYLTVNDTYYIFPLKSPVRLNLKPIILAAAAKNPEQYEENVLDDLDALAKDLENVTITGTVQDDSSAGVSLHGLTAAAVTSGSDGSSDMADLNYEDKAVTVAVSTAVKDTDGEAVAAKYSGDVTATDTAFSVDVSKSYNNGNADATVTDLAFEVLMTFDMPEEKPAEGEEYLLLREHDGKVESIDFEIDGETGKAYTDGFSSYAVVIAKKTEDKPQQDSKPAGQTARPAAPAASARTCQQAGYPAGYNWNENAKACQYGYNDDAGKWHYSAVSVPNTGDR